MLLLMVFSCVSPNSIERQDTSPWADWECGYDIGEHPCNFSLFDQHDQSVDLYDFYGKTILLDFSTTWCYYCNIAAMSEPELNKQYEDQGFIWLTVLVQDKNGKKPSCEVLKQWAGKYNISSPVLSGDMDLLDLEDDGINTGFKCGGYPTFLIIDKDMIIKSYIFGWSFEMINEAITQELNKENS
tara:strand:- start:65 stop:619 length:555 start_codon:yes stop_codon:yes gene_type:complete